MTEDLREARYYDKLPNKLVVCRLCPYHCRIHPGHSGICKVRQNIDGRLIARSYGQITSLALDPIEKKPLARFHPGSMILSLGSWGCNMHCQFCQNWQISQQQVEFREMTPQEVVSLARSYADQNNLGVAYTYNEPLINFEFLLDCARLVKDEHMMNVVVTNGLIESDPLEEILPLIDAMNIDLKGWHQSFYDELCGGDVAQIKQTIERSARSCHVEVTTLLIPGKNDNEQDIEAIAAWLASINPAIPLHLTRHHPDYRMVRPGPIEPMRMRRLADLASQTLEHVFLGNLMI